LAAETPRFQRLGSVLRRRKGRRKVEERKEGRGKKGNFSSSCFLLRKNKPLPVPGRKRRKKTT